MRYLCLLTLASLGALILFADPTDTQGQTSPGETKEVPEIKLAVDTLKLKPNDPLSNRTLVVRPGAVKGVRNYTLETKRHRWAAYVMAVSPNGQRIATGGYDGMVRVWNASDGSLERVLVGHDSYVYGLCWSPDSNFICSTGSWDLTARIWDARTGMTVRIFDKFDDYSFHVKWSPDGKKIAVAGGGSGFVAFFNPESNKQIGLYKFGSTISSIIWSPDSTLVALAAAKSGAAIIDTTTYKSKYSFTEANHDPQSVLFSLDGKILYTGSYTGLFMYDMTDGKKLKNSPSASSLLEHHPSGALWTGYSNSNLTKTNPETLIADKADSVVASSISITADRKHVYLLSGGTNVIKWDIEKKAAGTSFEVAESAYLTWGQGRPIVMGLKYQKTLTTWDPATGKKLATFDGHTQAPSSLCWHPGGKTFATCGPDKLVIVWDATTGKATRTLKTDGVPEHIALASDNKIAVACSDKTIRTWLATKDDETKLTGHIGKINTIAWSRDSKTLASGSSDHYLMLWAPETGKQTKKAHIEADIQSIAWSADQSRIAVGNYDDRLRVVQVSDMKITQTYEVLGNPPQVSSVCWTSDNNSILCGRANHTWQLWGTKNTKTAITNIYTMAPVHLIATSIDNKIVGACSADRAVRTYDLPGGRLRTTFIKDGDQLLAVSAEGQFRIADESTSELIAVIQTEKSQDTISIKEFTTKYNYRNNPATVK